MFFFHFAILIDCHKHLIRFRHEIKQCDPGFFEDWGVDLLVQVSIGQACVLLVLLGKSEVHPWDLGRVRVEELVAFRFHHDVVGEPVPEFNADLEKLVF